MASRRLAQQRTLIMSAAVEWLGWDVLAAKCLALSTWKGDLWSVLFRSLRGRAGPAGSAPLFAFVGRGVTAFDRRSCPWVLRCTPHATGWRLSWWRAKCECCYLKRTTICAFVCRGVTAFLSGEVSLHVLAVSLCGDAPCWLEVRVSLEISLCFCLPGQDGIRFCGLMVFRDRRLLRFVG